jgi:hypothetical protein
MLIRLGVGLYPREPRAGGGHFLGARGHGFSTGWEHGAHIRVGAFVTCVVHRMIGHLCDGTCMSGVSHHIREVQVVGAGRGAGVGVEYDPAGTVLERVHVGEAFEGSRCDDAGGTEVNEEDRGVV